MKLTNISLKIRRNPQKGQDHLGNHLFFRGELLHPLVKDNVAMKFMDPPCEEMTFLLKNRDFPASHVSLHESRDSGIPPPR